MNLRLLTLAIVLIATAGAGGADWLNVPDLNFTQRLSITVENPADVATDPALVHIALADLAKALPDGKPGQLAVVDPAMNRTPARDRANEYFVPFQVNRGN